MLPDGRRAGGEGCVQARPGDGDAKTVRPDQARAMRADEGEQLLLALDSLATDLGEAGRDHDESPHAVAERVLAAASTCCPAPRSPPDRRDPGSRHRRVATDAGDRGALRVDRIHSSGEIPLEHVSEELTADRAAPRRRADDGDALGLEERSGARPRRPCDRAPRRSARTAPSTRAGTAPRPHHRRTPASARSRPARRRPASTGSRGAPRRRTFDPHRCGARR